jgi:hypothetical protein
MRNTRPAALAMTVALLAAGAAFVVVKSQGAPRMPASEIVMMSDLKNLALRQELMKDSAGRYASSVEALDYSFSDGVIAPLIALTPDGYTISIGHRATTSRCVIYSGSTAIPPATRPDTPRCTDP